MDLSFIKPVIAAGLASFIVATSPAIAGEEHLSEEQRAQFEERFQENSARLNLTDDQKTSLEPILKENFEKRQELMETYNVTGEKMSRKEMRKRRGELKAFRSEMDTLREETNTRVAAILSDEQMATWTTIQEENKEAMRARMRG
ncbi:MAG: hypothetical protein AAFR21_00170 [Pseudomonadota bacterium]